MNWSKIFLVLISFLGNNLLFAMEEEKPPHSVQAAASPVLVAEYHREAEPLGPKIEYWAKDISNVFLHFYWTVGRLPEMVTPDKKNLPVPIGGQDYGETFFPSVEQFLKLVPEKVTVVMTCDHWTHEKNKEGFETLIEKFRKRFQIKFIEDEVKTLETLYPRHRQTIEQVFRNAYCGNPAIASDIYRLLIESSHCVESLGASSVIAYSDVDVFCGSFKKEGDDLEAFMENLFNPQYTGYFPRRNDFIKFSNSTKKRTEDTANQVFAKLEEILGGRTIISHFSKVIDFSEKFNKAPNEEIFTAYLRYSRDNWFCPREIIVETGPGLIWSLSIPQGLTRYAPIYAISWYDKDLQIPEGKSFTHGFSPVTIFDLKIKELAQHLETSGTHSFTLEQKVDVNHLIEKEVWDLNDMYYISTTELEEYCLKLKEKYSVVLDNIYGKSLEEYRIFKSRLSNLGFLRNFGESHPFYVELKTFILNIDPYVNSSSHLAEIIRIYFNFDRDHKCALSKEDWAKRMLYQIKCSNNGLNNIQLPLKNLGREFSLSQEDIIRMLEGL